MKIKTKINKAIDWFANSGIQNQSSNDNHNGGFHSWYNLDEANFGFIYSEITGYGITTLLNIYNETKNESYLNNAKRAYSWVSQNAVHSCGGILTRLYLDKTKDKKQYSFDNQIIYSFDTGMVLNGFIYLYKLTNDTRYLNDAKKLANFIINKMISKRGHICAIYDPKIDKIIDNDSKWSTSGGSFHAKIAIGMFELYSLTDDKKYYNSMSALCEFAMSKQESAGNFASFIDNNSTHLHPHLYSAEGLLYIGLKTSNVKYIESSLRAIQWLLDNQHKDGGIPCIYKDNKFSFNYRTDIQAQTIRLSIILIANGFLNKNYMENVDKIFYMLDSYHINNGISNGGILYGSSRNGTSKSCVNAWCSMFMLQSYILYRDYNEHNKINDEILFI